MNHSPFFSIIIPTYNRAALVKRAIDSVLVQEFQDFEIIVVNDGSTKDLIEYEELKNEYLKNDKVIIFDKQNGGLASARNSGIELAKSQFVCFLDDDDYYLPNHLSELNKLILKNSRAVGLYRTFSVFKEADGRMIPQDFFHYENKMHPVMYVLQYLLIPLNVCMERTIFEKYLFSKEVKISEDYEMWVKTLVDYPLFESFVHTAVYDRTRETMSSGSMVNFFKYIDSFETIFNNPKTLGIIPPEFVKSKYKKFYSWIIEEYLKENDILSFKKLKPSIIKRAGVFFYLKNYLRFIKKAFVK